MLKFRDLLHGELLLFQLDDLWQLRRHYHLVVIAVRVIGLGDLPLSWATLLEDILQTRRFFGHHSLYSLQLGNVGNPMP